MQFIGMLKFACYENVASTSSTEPHSIFVAQQNRPANVYVCFNAVLVMDVMYSEVQKKRLA